MQAKFGDTVKVHFVGRLPDGQVFAQSQPGNPVEFRIGEKRLLPGFEQAVVGMQPGETKTEAIPPALGYGLHDPAQLVTVTREQLGDEASVGERYTLRATNGDQVTATVVELSDETVLLDANHPLAGQEIVFDIHLLEIV
ncbi:MAG: peptidylprolyl isomerase [Anaerolineae bacterium]|nr:peptidylprolyl isomerase [Anaerolineae bacterium]